MMVIAPRDSTVSTELARESVALMKFWLVVSGIYIWEFVTSLHYEWSVIQGRYRYRWTIWVYSTTRLATLVVVVLNLIFLCVTSEINCQAWAYSTWFFVFLSFTPSSLLVVLRIFAIWNRNKVILAISAGIWITNSSLVLLGVAQIRTVWGPVQNACIITNIDTSKISIISLFVTDMTLLLIMLAGLLRHRSGGSLELGRLLWKQGVIWFAIATVADIPQTLFIILNLNDVLDILFLYPSLVALTIAATRMHRSLAHFIAPPNTAQDSETPQCSTRLVSAANTKHPSVVHIPSNRLEVTIHTAYEEYPISQTNHCASYLSSDAQLTDEPHNLASITM